MYQCEELEMVMKWLLLEILVSELLLLNSQEAWHPIMNQILNQLTEVIKSVRLDGTRC